MDGVTTAAGKPDGGVWKVMHCTPPEVAYNSQGVPFDPQPLEYRTAIDYCRSCEVTGAHAVTVTRDTGQMFWVVRMTARCEHCGTTTRPRDWE